MDLAVDNPKAVLISFQAREVPEPISFEINTSVPIISSSWWLPALHGGQWMNLVESRGSHHYAIALGDAVAHVDHKFLDEPFIVGLELETDIEPRRGIAGAKVWAPKAADAQIVYIELP